MLRTQVFLFLQSVLEHPGAYRFLSNYGSNPAWRRSRRLRRCGSFYLELRRTGQRGGLAVLKPMAGLYAVEAVRRVPEADLNVTQDTAVTPDHEGRVTLDACIMDGNCGSVLKWRTKTIWQSDTRLRHGITR